MYVHWGSISKKVINKTIQNKSHHLSYPVLLFNSYCSASKKKLTKISLKICLVFHIRSINYAVLAIFSLFCNISNENFFDNFTVFSEAWQNGSSSFISDMKTGVRGEQKYQQRKVKVKPIILLFTLFFQNFCIYIRLHCLSPFSPC